MSELHIPVLLKETIEGLNIKKDGIYVDGTMGGGGHSAGIAGKLSDKGHLYCFDQDEDAIKASTERLKDYKNITIVKSSYTNIKKVLSDLGISKITGGVLFDLGASYHQFHKGERGFSFSKEAPLDMRFNQDAEFSAYDVVNTYCEDDLVRIFSEYGEERFSKRIAKKIVEQRKLKKLETTTELANLIVNCTPHIKSSIHPATRVFQAIRIEVNQELTNVKNTLEDVLDLLEFGAIISVISFHSLEDRVVKQLFKYHSERCHCDKTQMICKCPPPVLEIVNKKPITASDEEIKINPPSRSAKLRIARCIRQN